MRSDPSLSSQQQRLLRLGGWCTTLVVVWGLALLVLYLALNLSTATWIVISIPLWVGLIGQEISIWRLRRTGPPFDQRGS